VTVETLQTVGFRGELEMDWIPCSVLDIHLGVNYLFKIGMQFRRSKDVCLLLLYYPLGTTILNT